MEFVDHIPQDEYPAGALAAAIYIVSGVRGMERGTMSEDRIKMEMKHYPIWNLVRTGNATTCIYTFTSEICG